MIFSTLTLNSQRTYSGRKTKSTVLNRAIVSMIECTGNHYGRVF